MADPIVVEETFTQAASVVWAALTDSNEMRQWYFEPMIDFQPVVGFETEFNVSCEGRDFLHQWKVTEVIPEKKIAYRWRYQGFEGDSVLSWELLQTKSGTIVRLTHSGQESFRGDPLFSRENGEAGWNYFVKQSLKSYLDSKEA